MPGALKSGEDEARLMHRFLIAILSMAVLAGAQTQESSQAGSSTGSASKQITVPAGTKVLLHLRSPINTKSARVGDDVYCETAFPVAQDNVMVIPARTYVKG